MIKKMGDYSPERIRDGLRRIKDAIDQEAERKESAGSAERAPEKRAR